MIVENRWIVCSTTTHPGGEFRSPWPASAVVRPLLLSSAAAGQLRPTLKHSELPGRGSRRGGDQRSARRGGVETRERAARESGDFVRPDCCHTETLINKTAHKTQAGVGHGEDATPWFFLLFAFSIIINFPAW